MLKLEIIGNIGADAEIRNINGESFCSFRVAHTSKYTDRQTGQIIESTQWVSVTINRDVTNLLPFLKRGTKVWCYGDCSTRLFIGHDGQKHAGLNLRAQSVELCGGNRRPDPAEIVQLLAEDEGYYNAFEVAKNEYFKLHPQDSAE